MNFSGGASEGNLYSNCGIGFARHWVGTANIEETHGITVNVKSMGCVLNYVTSIYFLSLVYFATIV